MSVSVARQSSSSSFSARSSSGLSLSRGAQLVGGGQTRMSSSMSMIKTRAPSVYAGAGGFDTRISVPTGGFSSSYSETAVIGNEKLAMQNLNDRLASYLEKVRSLEAANSKLELQIREYLEKRTSVASVDFSGFFATITDLRAQIMKKHLDNQRVILQIDNAQLAGDDFKIKYETELNIRTMVEGDVVRLRGVRDSLTLAASDLEMQIEGLKEELVYMKSNHEEEKARLRVQQSGAVNVEVDSAQSVDLSLVLQEVREQYEALALKNKQELDRWFQSKVEQLQTTITTSTEEVKTCSSELSELKRTLQSLEISRDGILTEIQCRQQYFDEVKSKYSVQLSQLQMTINALEAELQQLRVSIEEQKTEYNLLLDIKMRLELEIAEYRRLLDGELRERVQIERQIEKKAVVISKTVEVEEKKPHVERRVKTIVEEIVDGRVVSSVVDVEVEDIQ